MKRFALLLLVLIAGGGFAAFARARPAAPREGIALAELRAMEPVRTSRWQLSFPLPYRSCREIRVRSGAEEEHLIPLMRCADTREMPAAAVRLQGAAYGSDPDSLRAAALVSVIWRGGAKEDRVARLSDAITALQTSLQLSRDSLPRLVDLSAAYLARAEESGSTRDLVASLDHADTALVLDPRNASARWNRAVVLDLLGLTNSARAAWRDYLAVGGASPLAREARENLVKLLAPPAQVDTPALWSSDEAVASFAARSPQEARTYGWEVLLRGWGEDVEAGQMGMAVPRLRMAERIGAALVAAKKDGSLAEAVRAIRRAEANPGALRSLARAHVQYARIARITSGVMGTDTLDALLAAHPPSAVLREWAQIQEAQVTVYENGDRTESLLRGLIPEIDAAAFPALVARAWWLRGTAALKHSRYADARTFFDSAAAIYARLGEVSPLASIRANMGETLYNRGETEDGYRDLHRALTVLRDRPTHPFRANALQMAGFFAGLDGFPRAARIFADEMVAGAESPENRAEAYTARARLRLARGDTAGADSDVRKAAPFVGAIADSAKRKYAEHVVRLTRAMTTATRYPARSLAALDTVVSDSALSQIWRLYARLQRAGVRLTRGDRGGAAEDLDSVTRTYRRLTVGETNAARAYGMFEQARSPFDRLMLLHVQQRRYVQALRTLEAGRAAFDPGDTTDASTRTLQVGRGERAVEYALVGDEVLAWTVRSDSTRFQRWRVNRDSLLRTIREVNTAAEVPGLESRMDPRLEWLYDKLVRPLDLARDSTGEPLLIVADGEIAGVPFAALRDRVERRRVIDDFTLYFPPTLTRRAPTRTLDPESVLLVGDPALDGSAYTGLRRLSGAAREVDSLRLIYPRARILGGTAAVVDSFAALARGASLIHYAGHAVVDELRPERSYLVLAGRGTAGKLSADSLNHLRLSGVRLVVLSACRSLRPREGRAGGFAGFSGALLAAGVGGVIGSVWEVGDERTQPLMQAFHEALLADPAHDPARALRTAQRAMMTSSDRRRASPAAWAGFRYAGR